MIRLNTFHFAFIVPISSAHAREDGDQEDVEAVKESSKTP